MTTIQINPNDPVVDGCMATVSGKIINLFNVNPDDVLLSDIAHGLAYNCRWNGHTSTYYSVAEHCLRCVDRAPDELKLVALFHDCEEAYWGDMIRPLKNILKVVAPQVLESMKQTRWIILKKFGVEWDERISEFDHLELQWDFQNLILNKSHVSMPPSRAKHEWLQMAENLL